MIGRWDLDARKPSVAARGWWRSHKWWLLRRSSQVAAMAVFMLGPWLGLWLVRGNFASSVVLGVVPLSDPYILLQSTVAGHGLAPTALIGAGLILALYLVVGGRAYCAWVCPVNVVTDSAHWLREKTGLTRDRKLDRRTRLVVLAATLLAALLTGTIAWEFVNPVSMMQRGLITGVGLGAGGGGVPAGPVRVAPGVVQSSVPGGGLLRAGRQGLADPGGGHPAGGLYRLCRLLHHLPGTACNRPGAEGRGQPGDPRGRLPELRGVYRFLPRGRFPHDAPL